MENQRLKSFFETGKDHTPPNTQPANQDRPLSRPFTLDRDDGYEFAPAYRAKVGHLAPETGLTFTLDRKGEVELIPVREAPLGWRLRVDEFHLHFPFNADGWSSEKEALEIAGLLHHRLLSLGVYRPLREEVISYWQGIDHLPETEPGFPGPEAKARSLYLVGLVESRCPEIWSVLELGCGPGLNLSLLKTRLGIRVAGIELNRHALELGRMALPNLTGSSFFCADLQDQLVELADDSFELLFSLAGLMHLHPSVPEEFWSHLTRVAARYLITVEDEERTSALSWPRDYQRLLESQGARQVHQETVPDRITGLAGYRARVFAI